MNLRPEMSTNAHKFVNRLRGLIPMDATLGFKENSKSGVWVWGGGKRMIRKL